jgi:23S rRNA (pseudouridine1915-N3)-methyltransferase
MGTSSGFWGIGFQLDSSFRAAFTYSASMQLTLAHIGTRAASRDGLDALSRTYLERCTPWAQCTVEAFRTEAALFEWLVRKQGRTKAILVLFDSRGKQMTSEVFAAWLGARRDEGAQHIVFAIGPADGWSDGALAKAQLLLSLGPMTMAHTLARVVAAEQLYRAYTILTGHPYHGGH